MAGFTTLRSLTRRLLMLVMAREEGLAPTDGSYSGWSRALGELDSIARTHCEPSTTRRRRLTARTAEETS